MFTSMPLSLLLLVHLQKSALAGGDHEIAAAGWMCPSGTECVKKQDDYAGVRIRYPPGSGFLGGRFGSKSAGSRVPCSVAACVGPCAPGDLPMPACSDKRKVCAACAHDASKEDGDEGSKEAKRARRAHQQQKRRAVQKHALDAERAPHGAEPHNAPKSAPALRAPAPKASASRDALLTQSEEAAVLAEIQACIRHAQCTYTAHALHSRGMA